MQAAPTVSSRKRSPRESSNELGRACRPVLDDGLATCGTAPAHMAPGGGRLRPRDPGVAVVPAGRRAREALPPPAVLGRDDDVLGRATHALERGLVHLQGGACR